MNNLDSKLGKALLSRKNRGILRQLPPSSALTSTRVDFSSNDYLSLTSSLQLKTAFLNRLHASTHILGSGGSRLLDGGTIEHAKLEERLASFFCSPAALLYTSGYDANVGFFGCVPNEGDVVIYDALIHASVHDGMRSSRAARIPNSLHPFDHNNPLSLRAVINSILDHRPNLNTSGSVFIAVESLYSMDGDVAPLKDICEIVEQLLPARNGHIIVDEAHATGIYGPQGQGLVAYLGLTDRVTARLHTFGKALACSGGRFISLSVPKRS